MINESELSWNNNTYCLRVNNHMLVYIITILLILFITSGIFQQIQIILLKGKIIYPTIALKILILIILLYYNFMNREIFLYKPILSYWILFFCYLIVDIIFLLNNELSFTYILFSYNAYYYFYLLIPIFMSLKGKINEEKITQLFLGLFIPLSILGIAQFALSSPILKTESIDGYFKVFSWSFYGKVRAFSMFDSSLSFGNFISFIMGVILFRILNNRANIIVNYLLVLLLLISGYATLTRNVYIQLAFTVLSSVLIYYYGVRSKILFKIIPIINFIVGTFILMLSTIISGSSSNGILAGDSLKDRLNEWASINNMWFRNIDSIFFGTGLIQNDRYSFTSHIIVDNAFLAILLHIGLIGLIIWLALMWKIWIYIVNSVLFNRTQFNFGVASLWATWPISNIFNINLNIYIILFLLMICIKSKEKYNKNISI